ncbi:unnamed protein product [Closterium sp. Naga37s-1]|nr:unnamed protein product [Closterium sp. Naga37s-1]
MLLPSVSLSPAVCHSRSILSLYHAFMSPPLVMQGSMDDLSCLAPLTRLNDLYASLLSNPPVPLFYLIPSPCHPFPPLSLIPARPPLPSHLPLPALPSHSSLPTLPPLPTHSSLAALPSLLSHPYPPISSCSANTCSYSLRNATVSQLPHSLLAAEALPKVATTQPAQAPLWITWAGLNGFTGSIPSTISALTKLTDLYALTALNQLALFFNNLSGSIPAGITKLKGLQDL